MAPVLAAPAHTRETQKKLLTWCSSSLGLCDLVESELVHRLSGFLCFPSVSGPASWAAGCVLRKLMEGGVGDCPGASALNLCISFLACRKFHPRFGLQPSRSCSEDLAFFFFVLKRSKARCG